MFSVEKKTMLRLDYSVFKDLTSYRKKNEAFSILTFNINAKVMVSCIEGIGY